MFDAISDDGHGSGTVRVVDSDVGPHPWPRGTALSGGYRIERVLGQGGFAVVYEATHPDLGVVAVKVMDRSQVSLEKSDERFVREAEIAAALDHPNVLDVHDLGRAPDGSPFIVMELLMGEDLSDLIARQRLDVAAAVELGVQLTAAIEALSRAGVVHRDLKPHNVLMHRTDGVIRPKLIDFGIATSTEDSAVVQIQKLTRTGVILGTPHYLSPEQARGEDLDVRADLYALGVVLFEAVAGRAPFEDDNVNALMASVLRDERPRLDAFVPECPTAFADIIAKAIRRDRDERFQTPAELLEALASYADEAGLVRGDTALANLKLTTKMTLPWELRRLAPCEKRTGDRSAPMPLRSEDGFGGATLPRTLAAGHDQGPTAEWVPERRRGLRTMALAARRYLAPLAAAAGIVIGFAFAGFMSNDPGSRPALADAGPALAASAERPPEERTGPKHAVTRSDEPAAKAPRAGGQVSEAGGEAREADGAEPDEGDSAEASAQAEASGEAATDETAPSRPTPPSAEALERRAHRAYVRGRLAQARRLYRQATRQDPSLDDAWRGYGLVAARMGRSGEARRALQRYLRLAPGASDAGTIRQTLASL